MENNLLIPVPHPPILLVDVAPGLILGWHSQVSLLVLPLSPQERSRLALGGEDATGEWHISGPFISIYELDGLNDAADAYIDIFPLARVLVFLEATEEDTRCESTADMCQQIVSRQAEMWGTITHT